MAATMIVSLIGSVIDIVLARLERQSSSGRTAKSTARRAWRPQSAPLSSVGRGRTGIHMRRILIVSIAGALLVAQAAAAQEVTLRAITAFAEGTTYSRPFERFIERVNQDGKDLVKINYIGGTKATAPFE